MKRDTLQWAVVLKTCGVQNKEVNAWAPLFADNIKDGTFSLGDKEIDLFLGNILHESGMLTHMEEGLNYSTERIIEMGNASKPGTRWRSLVPIAASISRNPKAMANAVYGGRLGNVKPNDGWDYRGSGPIQITGLDNFTALAKLTGLPLVEHPELLRTPTKEALLVCIAWWEGNVPDRIMACPRKVRQKVNGGDFGLAETTRIAGLADAALLA